MKLKSTYLFIYYLFIYLNNYSQINLVPNPSFEDTIGGCQSQMGITTFWSNVKNWKTNHVYSSPDYYNICANAIVYPNICTIPYSSRSYQNPHAGNAYTAIGTYYIDTSNDSINIGSEYISCSLNSPLKQNTCYYAEFFTNLSNISEVTINQISILFTQNTFTTAPYSYTNTIQPQIQWDTTQCFTDTLNWVKISGTFVAQGGEKYLTIGNFRDGAHLKKESAVSIFTPAFGSFTTRFFTYILIDDVALYELPTPQLQSNAITICPNADTLTLGDTARIQTRYQWFANGTAIDTTSFIKVKPNYNLRFTNHPVWH